MPGVEDEAAVGVLEALGELVLELRATRGALAKNTAEVTRLCALFEKIEAKPVERPILDRDMPGPGAVPGTVPAAQIVSAAAQFVRALNAGGRKVKKKRGEDE